MNELFLAWETEVAQKAELSVSLPLTHLCIIVSVKQFPKQSYVDMGPPEHNGPWQFGKWNETKNSIWYILQHNIVSFRNIACQVLQRKKWNKYLYYCHSRFCFSRFAYSRHCRLIHCRSRHSHLRQCRSKQRYLRHCHWRQCYSRHCFWEYVIRGIAI